MCKHIPYRQWNAALRRQLRNENKLVMSNRNTTHKINMHVNRRAEHKTGDTLKMVHAFSIQTKIESKWKRRGGKRGN